MKRMEKFVYELTMDAANAKPSQYKEGYIAALAEVMEYIENRLWEEDE